LYPRVPDSAGGKEFSCYPALNFIQRDRLLLELRVENYAVIDNVAVEFAPGLNLLTGETGAGKSILIDALTLLLGERASNEMIRHGEEKAMVSAVFESRDALIAATLEANGIDSEDGQVIIRREIATGGKGRVFINNQPATVAVLRQLAPALAAVHAQNETLASFDAAERRRLLDVFAGAELGGLIEAHDKWKSLKQKIEELQRDESDRLKLLDLWSFQAKEIADARLVAGEDVALENEKRVLANSEKLYTAAMTAHEALYESNASAAALLRSAEKNIEELSRYDTKFVEVLASLETVRINVEDVGSGLRDYAASIDASPERLAEIEDRLAVLDRLKRKYGPALENVMAFGEEVTTKIAEIENRDEILAQLKKSLTTAAAEYLKAASATSKLRHGSAQKLEKLVEAEINDLAMKVRFKVDIASFDDEEHWTSAGFDEVRYLIATNAGEPLKPIEQIASGGEMSRVMLALKATIETSDVPRAKKQKHQELRTLIFDEIDTGIGGRAAEAVGKKLKSLAAGNQVLCITHLPQIASFADQHFVIEKRESSGRTKTSIRRLDPTERAQEIARMMSGQKVTETSLKHAEQMLKANA
jgi:DNA repair protein RecN (Recombination protein N)